MGHKLSADYFQVLLQAAARQTFVVQRRLQTFNFLGIAVTEQTVVAHHVHHLFYLYSNIYRSSLPCGVRGGGCAAGGTGAVVGAKAGTEELLRREPKLVLK